MLFVDRLAPADINVANIAYITNQNIINMIPTHIRSKQYTTINIHAALINDQKNSHIIDIYVLYTTYKYGMDDTDHLIFICMFARIHTT